MFFENEKFILTKIMMFVNEWYLYDDVFKMNVMIIVINDQINNNNNNNNIFNSY